MGAAVGFFFQETDLKKAFVLGIGVPALITSAATGKRLGEKDTAFVLPNFITSAYAQNPAVPAAPTGSPVFGRILNVNLASPVPINVQFLDDRENPVLTAILEQSGQIPVPGLAQKVRFVVRDALSAAYPLPSGPGESKTLNVNVTGDRRFGFQQAWGAPPDVTFRISVN